MVEMHMYYVDVILNKIVCISFSLSSQIVFNLYNQILVYLQSEIATIAMPAFCNF